VSKYNCIDVYTRFLKTFGSIKNVILSKKIFLFTCHHYLKLQESRKRVIVNVIRKQLKPKMAPGGDLITPKMIIEFIKRCPRFYMQTS